LIQSKQILTNIMTKYTIHAYPQAPTAKKALICAEFGGISDEISYPQDFKFGVDNKTDEFLKISPLGKVPAMTTPEGGLFESNAMARYIARKGNDAAGLLGADAYTSSLIDAWVDFTSFCVTDAWYLFGFRFGYGQYNEESFNKSKKTQQTAFSHVEGHLNRTGNSYLVGDRVTLADIIFAATVNLPLQHALDAEFRKEFPKTEAYLRRVFDNEHVKKVCGDVQFLDKFTAPQ
jgi:elongation factor 1-gamma